MAKKRKFPWEKYGVPKTRHEIGRGLAVSGEDAPAVPIYPADDPYNLEADVKRSPLRRRGRSRFPKRRDLDYQCWISGQPCLVCGARSVVAHVKTQGSGGYDRGNIVPLCCLHHGEQEGRTAAFEVEYGVDLLAAGARFTETSLEETGL